MKGKLNNSVIFYLVALFTFCSCQSKDQKVETLSELNVSELHVQPNIVLLYADDLGWTDLGVQGSDYYQTPHIDQFAKESLSFSNAYSNAPNCAPSRACLMTGLYTPRHGIYTVSPSARGKSESRKLIPTPNISSLDSSFFTLPQSMKQAGYKTCMAGKWHLSNDPKKFGFDENFGGYSKGHPKSYFSPYHNPNLEDGPIGEYLPERLTSDVTKWIDENQNSPFFLYFPFYLVHSPNQPKAELAEKYEHLSKGLNHNVPSYAAMVEAMDIAVGKVLSKLKELKLDDNTIIIFTSDNGPSGANSNAKPLRGAKGMMYEGGIRVPFMIKWNGNSRIGQIDDTPIIGSDLYPTILQLIGQREKPIDFDGLSFVGAMNGQRMNERALFWHFPAYLELGGRDKTGGDSHDKPHFRATPCSAIRLGDWKLIRYYETEEIELFNLKKDISETTNRAATNTKKKDELLLILDGWLQKTTAPIQFALNATYTSEN